MTRASAVSAAAMLALAGLCGGCNGVPVHVGDHVPPDVDRSSGRTVWGSATGYQLLGFVPYDNNDRHQRAYEQLKQDAGNAWITDVAVKESWSYLLLATGYTTTFRATAYPKTAAPADVPPPPPADAPH